MCFKRGSWKLILTFIIATTFEYRTTTTYAERLVNVRKTHKLQSRSLLFPPTAPTRVQNTTEVNCNTSTIQSLAFYSRLDDFNLKFSKDVYSEFIGGIGIPVEDLNFESVTSGYVLKAEYFLPETADEFRQKLKPQTIHRRRKSVNGTNIYYEDFDNVTLVNEIKNNIYTNETLNLSQHMKHEIHKKHLFSSESDNFKSQQKHGDLYRWLVYKAMETILNKSALNGRACMLRSICEHAAIPLNYEGGLLAEILHIILTPSASRDESVMPSHKDYLRAEILGRSGEDCEEAYRQCTKSPMEIISAVFET